ncbi:hypothetical protein GGR50DRAFT_67057 [Xylaria sp. CBS 124048]|nr:hypothetical protein GGR50DRAFT_67057 [Xylaria sp. CBS 124048]
MTSPSVATASSSSTTTRYVAMNVDVADAADGATLDSFTCFSKLPNELRHKIWALAIPSPGINFFNVHCFPNDHEGANRSTSPAFAYLDLRRQRIEHSDDEVARYDPSVWQARTILRQVCYEARAICTIPKSKLATITLTRPARGLFVRARDHQLLNTPFYLRPDTPAAALPPVEPVVYRTIDVHTDDILCLSVDNCSFDLAYEEAEGHLGEETELLSATDFNAAGEMHEPFGWTYDPQIIPPLPQEIHPTRLCVSLRWTRTISLQEMDILKGILWSHIPDYFMPELTNEELFGSLLIFLEHETNLVVGRRSRKELKAMPEEIHDRFGDTYVWFASPDDDLFNEEPETAISKALMLLS